MNEPATLIDSTSSSTMSTASTPAIDSTHQSENSFEPQAAPSDVGAMTPLASKSATSIDTSESPVSRSATVNPLLHTSNDELPTLRIIDPEPVSQPIALTAHYSLATANVHVKQDVEAELYREVFPTDLPPRPASKRSFFIRLLSRPANRPVDIELATHSTQQPNTAADGMVDVDLGNQLASDTGLRYRSSMHCVGSGDCVLIQQWWREG
jgi:hypothetical protein